MDRHPPSTGPSGNANCVGVMDRCCPDEWSPSQGAVVLRPNSWCLPPWHGSIKVDACSYLQDQCSGPGVRMLVSFGEHALSLMQLPPPFSFLPFRASPPPFFTFPSLGLCSRPLPSSPINRM